ncbi:hypothetical protein XENTR_v10004240 [Xenopus tropicalis]|nr:hypothetical protein XENTR_v10004240 [Xenopus tropicalis]
MDKSKFSLCPSLLDPFPLNLGIIRSLRPAEISLNHVPGATALQSTKAALFMADVTRPPCFIIKTVGL